MGLSRTSVGRNTETKRLVIKKENETDLVVALAGNPNVGKSTVFNQLTGLKQHTGNWPGKTVTNAQGYCKRQEQGYVLVDIPGCYSLMAHSTEEEVARDFICFEHPDAVVVVCDASCLERNLNLVLQIQEAYSKVVVCVNMMDEAKKKKIKINLSGLSKKLGIPVIGTTARSKKGLEQIFTGLKNAASVKENPEPLIIYPDYIEESIQRLEPILRLTVGDSVNDSVNVRWLCARLLDADESLLSSIEKYLGSSVTENEQLQQALDNINKELEAKNISKKKLNDEIAGAFIRKAEELCQNVICCENKSYNQKDRRLDRIFTSKLTGFPIMFLVLMFIFWLTVTGANYPSNLLSNGLFWIEDKLVSFAISMGAPKLLYEMLIFGVYRVLAWVISVMLPPMAIFFPLFTLLEDFGYLPRVAFNLDKCFKCCHACGKQALTMAMGFGCNAAGIIGCRIIDSKRERLIAMITNNFVPCNGRIPILITIISMFFVGKISGVFSSLFSAVLLAGIIVLGILMTILVSAILSRTILKGEPSSFTLELPPYRRPQVGKVIIRSIFDRTLFVLGRAAMIAAPAGLMIWLLANITIGDITILKFLSGALDPFAQLLGMDGVILLAFILGLPANEIVIPIMIMTYMAQGSLTDISDLNLLKQVLTENGWTWITAVSTMLFALMHWPCSTTCLTIKKESQSVKWMFVSILVPTITGFIVCFLFTTLARLIAG